MEIFDKEGDLKFTYFWSFHNFIGFNLNKIKLVKFQGDFLKVWPLTPGPEVQVNLKKFK